MRAWVPKETWKKIVAFARNSHPRIGFMQTANTHSSRCGALRRRSHHIPPAFTLVTHTPNEWKTDYIIAMIIVGLVVLVAFGFYEIYLAKHPSLGTNSSPTALSFE